MYSLFKTVQYGMAKFEIKKISFAAHLWHVVRNKAMNVFSSKGNLLKALGFVFPILMFVVAAAVVIATGSDAISIGFGLCLLVAGLTFFMSTYVYGFRKDKVPDVLETPFKEAEAMLEELGLHFPATYRTSVFLYLDRVLANATLAYSQYSSSISLYDHSENKSAAIEDMAEVYALRNDDLTAFVLASFSYVYEDGAAKYEKRTDAVKNKMAALNRINPAALCLELLDIAPRLFDLRLEHFNKVQISSDFGRAKVNEVWGKYPAFDEMRQIKNAIYNEKMTLMQWPVNGFVVYKTLTITAHDEETEIALPDLEM